MLTSAEQAMMQASLEQLLPDTCNILSVSYTPDSQGGETESWGTATAGVKCRLDPGKRAVESLGGEALLPFSWWTLTLPHDAVLTTAQRVTIGAATYDVESVDTGKSWEICIRAVVTLL